MSLTTSIYNEFTCSQATDLFSPYLDGEFLSEDDRKNLEKHLSTCDRCSHEIQNWKAMAETLRSLDMSVSAPNNFCYNVMSNLNQHPDNVLEFKKKPTFARARYYVAAVAAAALVFGSTWGVNFGSKVAKQNTEVAVQQPRDNGQSEIILDNKSQTSKKENTTNNSIDNNKSEKASNSPGTIDNSKQLPTNNINPASTQPQKQVSAVSETGQKVFLATNAKIESSILKLSVKNSDEASAKAISYAKSFSGQAETITQQQKDSKRVQVLRMIVPKNKGEGFISQTLSLGAYINRQDDTRDITDAYNEVQAKQQEILQNLKSTSDLNTRKQLENDLAALKQQQQAWDNELKNYIILLWLEENKGV